jgi:hypothetical protein
LTTWMDGLEVGQESERISGLVVLRFVISQGSELVAKVVKLGTSYKNDTQLHQVQPTRTFLTSRVGCDTQPTTNDIGRGTSGFVRARSAARFRRRWGDLVQTK